MEKHVFRIYDENNDGHVDFVEFMVVYTIMAGGTSEDILKKIFRLFDVNSDGSISKKEMKRLVKDMYGLLKREDPNISAADLVAKTAFAFLTEHPTGKMKPKDFRELMNSALPKKDASKMEKHVFRIYDENNDGHVDFVEFMVVYTIMAGGTSE